MLRSLTALGLLIAAAVAQSLIGPALPLVGSRPDFSLVVVLTWGMLRGPIEGAVAGFVGGILLDSATYVPFGLNGALLGLAGYCIGLPEANVYRGNFPFFLATAAIATLVYHTLMYLALQASGLSMPPMFRAYQIAVPAAFLNVVLLAPTFLLCRRLLRALDGWTQLKL